jgi:hypothetical protein
MKKYYRVSVPAFINFDVAAESEDQAKRIAAATVYTPDSDLFRHLPLADVEDLSGQLSVWCKGENLSGHLDGHAVEIVDSGSRYLDDLLSIESNAARIARVLGNEAEYAAAKERR